MACLGGYTVYNFITLESPNINPNGRYVERSFFLLLLKYSYVFQTHWDVVFLHDTFPNISWGWVQIQWNLGCWMTLRHSTRLRFSTNPMNSCPLNGKWNPLILTEIQSPSKIAKGLIQNKNRRNWWFQVSPKIRSLTFSLSCNTNTSQSI